MMMLRLERPDGKGRNFHYRLMDDDGFRMADLSLVEDDPEFAQSLLSWFERTPMDLWPAEGVHYETTPDGSPRRPLARLRIYA